MPWNVNSVNPEWPSWGMLQNQRLYQQIHKGSPHYWAILCLQTKKQLRQFLGTCGFHHKFVINFADFVAPMVLMLKKGVKWEWTAQLQKAFECLHSQFTNSIHLVHPDKVTIQYSHWCFQNCSRCTANADPWQWKNAFVSAASRVLTANAQQYSTCTLELLAIVYALSKLRICVFGYKILLKNWQ